MTPAEDKDVIQYSLRRLDTGEFYWTPKHSIYHRPPPGDPRWSNWTKDMNKAKLYSWRGIVSLAGHHKKDYHNNPLPYKVEIIKVKLVIEEIIPVVVE
jgi:hypothetical protein